MVLSNYQHRSGRTYHKTTGWFSTLACSVSLRASGNMYFKRAHRATALCSIITFHALMRLLAEARSTTIFIEKLCFAHCCRSAVTPRKKRRGRGHRDPTRQANAHRKRGEEKHKGKYDTRRATKVKTELHVTVRERETKQPKTGQQPKSMKRQTNNHTNSAKNAVGNYDAKSGRQLGRSENRAPRCA